MNGSVNRKSNKLTVFIAAVIAVVVAGFLWFYYSLSGEVRRAHGNGIIISMKDTTGFMNIVVKEAGDTVAFDVYHDERDSFFSFAQVGDSVVKEKGSQTLTGRS